MRSAFFRWCDNGAVFSFVSLRLRSGYRPALLTSVQLAVRERQLNASDSPIRSFRAQHHELSVSARLRRR